MNMLGAQLYTVRQCMGTDEEMQSTFVKIKEIGYDSVQLFGSAELAGRCAEAAARIGLQISGVLADLDSYEKDLEAYLQLCDEYHVKDLAVSAVVLCDEAVEHYIKRANVMARKIRERGHTFSYHNHASEFIKLADGRTILEHYMAGFDPELIDFMPDTYWIQKGGYDVRYLLERLRGRVKILHLKDMKCTEKGTTFAEVGKGNLYFEGILSLALDCGIHEFVVEQDQCDGDPIESLKQSFAYIKSLRLPEKES